MSRDLFQGTVPYYARYRVPYPQPLLSQVCEQAQLTGTGRLLDLGCGTGELAIRLAPRFQEVIAVDPDAEMLATAKQKARDQQVPNIQWRHHSAEQLTAEPGSCELVTIGAAFHWMDRPVMASRIKTWLQPQQPLVILGYTSIWSGNAAWHPLVRNVLKRWLGEKRRAGSGEFNELAAPHELVLLDAGYQLEEIRYEYSQAWTLDDLLGNLYSTSFASPAVLGEKRADFEADLRTTLLDFDRNGVYEEQMTFYALLARVESK
ncbi:MAG: SAM-dependent methyltransferase [Gimesia sp.]|uniref:class I SAM-dependent methyltransferase n=2 Tax=Gimesia TaxID=1649453 RepID=UPI000C582AFD|nr:class I SAM-dependent methyltransferase [Gimesia sp.]MAX36367.1 SAM-dependent methyltransferase [Gimesia sp.]